MWRLNTTGQWRSCFGCGTTEAPVGKHYGDQA
jgi:hypothetical protein